MVNDIVGDTIARLYNASKVKKEFVDVMYSNVVVSIIDVLQKSGFVISYENIQRPYNEGGNMIRVYLKYEENGSPVITGIKRVSSPGCRVYRKSSEINKVLNGRGIGIYSTSQGVLSDRDAFKRGLGGEYLCKIW